MKLCEMAQEYRVNVALLELRIKQLQAAQKRARQPEVRYRLKQRAKFLQTLINASGRHSARPSSGPCASS